MQNRGIIVIDTSAGGVKAARQRFVKDLMATIFIVQHLSADLPSLLPQILSDAGPLRAEQAREAFMRHHLNTT